jgi:hypothetical protein
VAHPASIDPPTTVEILDFGATPSHPDTTRPAVAPIVTHPAPIEA